MKNMDMNGILANPCGAIEVKEAKFIVKHPMIGMNSFARVNSAKITVVK